MDVLKPPSVEVYSFLPENFLHKSVNEPFIQQLMAIVLNRDNWRPGNAVVFEPDYFCDGVPFEFTIASDHKKKNNYIQRFRSGSYTSEDIEYDIFQYIQEAITKKLEKHYSVPNIHLCVLCLMDLTYWVLDEYGSLTHSTLDYSREEFFEWIRKQCLNTGQFSNVFIIFPDLAATWWVWDVQSRNKVCINLSTTALLSLKYPFWLNKTAFEELQLATKESGAEIHGK